METIQNAPMLEMHIDEILFVGYLVELKGSKFLKVDKSIFKMVLLGVNEDKTKRWGIVVPKDKVKEFAEKADEWILPDELEALLEHEEEKYEGPSSIGE